MKFILYKYLPLFLLPFNLTGQHKLLITTKLPIISHTLYSNSIILNLNKSTKKIWNWNSAQLENYEGDFNSKFPTLSPDGLYKVELTNNGLMNKGIKYFIDFYSINSSNLEQRIDLSGKALYSAGPFSGLFATSIDVEIDSNWKYYSVINPSHGITLFNLKSDKEICQIHCTGLDDILITIPSGYYMATRRGAFEGINFEYEGQIFDFAQFDVQFNRPDLVLEHIGLSSPATIAAFKKAHEKRLKKLNITQESANIALQIPIIEWEKDLPVFTDKDQIEVAISAKSEQSSLHHLNIYVNGVPLYGKHGHRIKDQKAKSYSNRFKLNLTSGDNRIEVEAFDQFNRVSRRLQAVVRCETPEVKPSLHIVTIGVSHYADSRQNLLFAAVDAQKVEELFKERNSLYQRVVSYPLRDTDFNKQGLEKVRKSLLQTKESDQVIIFYAGHGLLDVDLNYYLGTTQVDFNNPSQNGILYSLVESLLDSIPARQRLIMLDACFSGNIDGENTTQIKLENSVKGSVRLRSSGMGLLPGNTENERIFNLMREWFIDLSPNIGATVLSAATGMQEAQEGSKGKNGDFTWCLLKGVRDKQADRNKDNKIMLSELRDYLEVIVPNQTDHKQQPSFRAENLVTDWQIW